MSDEVDSKFIARLNSKDMGVRLGALKVLLEVQPRSTDVLNFCVNVLMRRAGIKPEFEEQFYFLICTALKKRGNIKILQHGTVEKILLESLYIKRKKSLLEKFGKTKEEDHTHGLRMVLVETLGEVGANVSVRGLKELIRKESDQLLREAAKSALEQIDRRKRQDDIQEDDLLEELEESEEEGSSVHKPAGVSSEAETRVMRESADDNLDDIEDSGSLDFNITDYLVDDSPNPEKKLMEREAIPLDEHEVEDTNVNFEGDLADHTEEIVSFEPTFVTEDDELEDELEPMPEEVTFEEAGPEDEILDEIAEPVTQFDESSPELPGLDEISSLEEIPLEFDDKQEIEAKDQIELIYGEVEIPDDIGEMLEDDSLVELEPHIPDEVIEPENDMSAQKTDEEDGEDISAVDDPQEMASELGLIDEEPAIDDEESYGDIVIPDLDMTAEASTSDLEIDEVAQGQIEEDEVKEESAEPHESEDEGIDDVESSEGDFSLDDMEDVGSIIDEVLENQREAASLDGAEASFEIDISEGDGNPLNGDDMFIEEVPEEEPVQKEEKTKVEQEDDLLALASGDQVFQELLEEMEAEDKPVDDMLDDLKNDEIEQEKPSEEVAEQMPDIDDGSSINGSEWTDPTINVEKVRKKEVSTKVDPPSEDGKIVEKSVEKPKKQKKKKSRRSKSKKGDESLSFQDLISASRSSKPKKSKKKSATRKKSAKKELSDISEEMSDQLTDPVKEITEEIRPNAQMKELQKQMELESTSVPKEEQPNEIEFTIEKESHTDESIEQQTEDEEEVLVTSITGPILAAQPDDELGSKDVGEDVSTKPIEAKDEGSPETEDLSLEEDDLQFDFSDESTSEISFEIQDEAKVLDEGISVDFDGGGEAGNEIVSDEQIELTGDDDGTPSSDDPNEDVETIPPATDDDENVIFDDEEIDLMDSSIHEDGPDTADEQFEHIDFDTGDLDDVVEDFDERPDLDSEQKEPAPSNEAEPEAEEISFEPGDIDFDVDPIDEKISDESTEEEIVFETDGAESESVADIQQNISNDSAADDTTEEEIVFETDDVESESEVAIQENISEAGAAEETSEEEIVFETDDDESMPAPESLKGTQDELPDDLDDVFTGEHENVLEEQIDLENSGEIDLQKGDDLPQAEEKEKPAKELSSNDITLVPILTEGMGNITELEVDMEQGYILSLVDGSTSLLNIAHISGMGKDKTLKVINGLFKMGFVSFKDI